MCQVFLVVTILASPHVFHCPLLASPRCHISPDLLLCHQTVLQHGTARKAFRLFKSTVSTCVTLQLYQVRHMIPEERYYFSANSKKTP